MKLIDELALFLRICGPMRPAEVVRLTGWPEALVLSALAYLRYNEARRVIR